MPTLKHLVRTSLTCLTLVATLRADVPQGTVPPTGDKDSTDQNSRPKLTLKAQPAISMAPSRVILTAELAGGANDFEDYYCPTVEWEWGDGTTSEATSDCEPYQRGKSQIKRRFVVEHRFRAGNYRVMFRLKRRDKLVASATANVQVRPGLADSGN